MEYLYLTTIGRRTGQPREIEIWFVEWEGRFYLVAQRRERSHWVRNIRADPRVTFRVGARTYAGTARVVEEPDLAARARRLSEEKYGWGDGLVVELSPARS